jgi:hypothetical protein
MHKDNSLECENYIILVKYRKGKPVNKNFEYHTFICCIAFYYYKNNLSIDYLYHDMVYPKQKV